MAVHKLSVSVTAELDVALARACLRRGMNKSRLIEVLLREHPSMKEFIQFAQEEPNASVATAPGKSATVRHSRSRKRAPVKAAQGAPSFAPIGRKD